MSNAMQEAHRKVIVITGASRGIGRAIAIELAGEGVALGLISTNAGDMAETRMRCMERGSSEVICFGMDLSEISLIDGRMGKLIDELGPIDVLVNNAGIWKELPFMEADMDAWDKALDVNLKAPMRLTHKALEGMPEGGAVVFIGSAASKRGYAGGTGYCAGKFGLLGFASSLFEDVRERGIKVCSILPGVVDTDMHAGDPALEAGKMIAARDVAQAVAAALAMPINVCPTEIALSPQRNPKKAKR